MAPYCTIPRDYLSDTPLLRAMGFWCLNMASWVRYPLLRFLSVSPLEYKCEVEVRYPPSKGVSQRYLRDTQWKQGKWVRYPLLRYYLERVLRDMGGISHWAAKSRGQQDREPLRGSLRGRVVIGFERFSEVFRGCQRFLEVFRDFAEVFRGPLRGTFPSQRLSVLLPLIVLPLDLSPNDPKLRMHIPRTSGVIWADVQGKRT